MWMTIKTRVGATSPALVRNTQVQDQWQRYQNISQVCSKRLFGSRMGSTGANMITKNITSNSLQPQAESDNSVNVGICEPTQVTKKDYQRPTDQVSSRWWGLITPRNPRGLYYKILFGSSSSWDSRTPISVPRTLSSTVVTIHFCEWRWSCSARHETTKVSWRSLNDCHRWMIWHVTLCWSGMETTLEVSSPHTSVS